VSLKKASKLLDDWDGGIETLYEAIDECFKSRHRSLDLYAAVLAMATENLDVAKKYVNGPSGSERWGGTCEGAKADLKSELKKRLEKKNGGDSKPASKKKAEPKAEAKPKAEPKSEFSTSEKTKKRKKRKKVTADD